jgi:hypothetical protein
MDEKYQIGDNIFIIVAGLVYGGKIQGFDDEFYKIGIDPGGIYYKNLEEVFKDELTAKIHFVLTVFNSALRNRGSLREFIGRIDEETMEYITENYPEKFI